MKHLLVILLCLPIGLTLSAQKQYKELRTYIKSGSNLDKALELVESCKKDSLLRDDPELYRLAVQVHKERYEAQNTKLYLKQSYDTAVFFSSIYGIFENSLLWDAKECIPDSKGRIRSRSRAKIRAELRPHCSNLYQAGLHYLRKQNWAEAYKFLSLYISLDTVPIFAQDSLNQTDARRPRAAFYAMRASFEQKDYPAVAPLASLAEKDTANLSYCLQYQAIAARNLGQTEQMVETLKKGISLVPENHYFFSQLIDHYLSLGDYEASLGLCQSCIEADSTVLLYHFAHGVVLYRLGWLDECLSEMLIVSESDTSFVEAPFYIGSCYYNLSLSIEETITPSLTTEQFADKRTQAQTLLAQACGYFERYRALCPDDTNRWAMPLYKIYLALNEAQKFREIEALLQNSPPLK